MPAEQVAIAALTETAEATARSIQSAARAAKRNERASRKHALELMRGLDRLRAQCAELGIHLSIEDTDPKEGQSHG